MHYLCFWYELKQCIGTMVLSGLELSEVHTCVSWLHLVKEQHCWLSCVTLVTHVFKLQYASNLDICCVVYVDVLSKYVI
jgi:hypothetical protein